MKNVPEKQADTMPIIELEDDENDDVWECNDGENYSDEDWRYLHNSFLKFCSKHFFTTKKHIILQFDLFDTGVGDG